MTEPRIASYGSWKSPITSDVIVASSVGLGALQMDGDTLYWLERRAEEGGRSVVVQRTPDGRTIDRTPAPFDARTRVHEYGGGSYRVHAGTVYFSNNADQRLYRSDPEAEPLPLTTAPDLRYADAVLDAARGRLICVREDHTVAGREAVNSLAAVDLEGDTGGRLLASGCDFYASPALSPDGSRLAWLQWNHPNMPWDGCELWVARIGPGGELVDAAQVAGSLQESIFQPQWAPDGLLHWISDRTGWWNLYRMRDGQVEPLYPMEAEFGKPQWQFGVSTYGFLAPDTIICIYSEKGIDRLARLDTNGPRLEPFDLPYTAIGGLQVDNETAVFIGGSSTAHPAVVRLDLTTGEHAALRRSSDLEVDARYLSIPRTVEFPTAHGLTAHAFFYPPRNDDFVAPDGERPPLLVTIHGGPTSATSSVLRFDIQYWTSRGIAILDVNYGGSTGYGRAYRERLKGQWGIVDVDDCVNGARYIVEQGEADGDRLAIRGGSAGGYTTLAALTFRDLFAAGASYYGVSDAEALAQEMHKFESRYLDQLIGAYPERRDLYRERSPIHYVDRLAVPVIFFQGLDDPVVPPNQAEMMVEALRGKGVPVAYLPFEGEQHGFRRAENIKRALDAELYFYGRIFGFQPADAIEPVAIDNLDGG